MLVGQSNWAVCKKVTWPTNLPIYTSESSDIIDIIDSNDSIESSDDSDSSDSSNQTNFFIN